MPKRMHRDNPAVRHATERAAAFSDGGEVIELPLLLTRDEMQIVKHLARNDGVNIGTWLRRAIRSALYRRFHLG